MASRRKAFSSILFVWFAGIPIFLMSQLSGYADPLDAISVAIETRTGPSVPVSNTQTRADPEASKVSGYKILAEQFARKSGLPPQIANAVMEIESNFDPSSRGAAGEVGLMQIMPPTAAMLGFSGSLEDLAHPESNIELGVRYLAEAYRLAEGDLCTAVMKYRAGHGERRFSVRSVDYCKRARQILKRDGFEIAGSVPEPTFGFAARVSARSPALGNGTNRKLEAYSVCVTRSFVAGPGYGRCLKSGTVTVARHAIEQRKKLFD